MFDKIKELKKALSALDDGDVFRSNKEIFDIVVTACLDIVKEAGYKVVFPEDEYGSIDGPVGLLNFFNGLLQYKHPDYMISGGNIKKNRSIIRSFIESRKKASNLTEREAIKECAKIIHTIFQHEDEFNFESPINIGLLGQANLGWVTEKAINIINGKKMKKELYEQERAIELFDKEYDKANGGSSWDLDEILKLLKEEDYEGRRIKGET
jgi:hypothetical protein